MGLYVEATHFIIPTLGMGSLVTKARVPCAVRRGNGIGDLTNSIATARAITGAGDHSLQVNVSNAIL